MSLNETDRREAERLAKVPHYVHLLQSEIKEISDFLLRIAQEQDSGDAYYQVWRSMDSCSEFWSWEDVDKELYDDEKNLENKRVLYAHP